MVLDYNETEHKALLLSKYGLDAQRYHTELMRVTWETCTLRTWLNKDFYDGAFTKIEKEAILTTAADNSKSQGFSRWHTYGGNNTQDKIFLLSYAEANQYLGVIQGNSDNVLSRVSVTAYAQQRGASVNNGNPVGWWWLRSPGTIQNCGAVVNDDGSLGTRDVYNASGCVRPALWVNLESDIF